ncbi:ImmA/IrrE family metallo-endopeptidase [Paenibacillus farraposensis]|uniref:ImmA/IrrE family metallo-endopeptidase n=1 Tax=Paenibacillus farraposensis TaxID=2807095 RepID=A0ABW4D744_9BACL|nr:ImmA/IrrE family metallo-endopeptidase [Paenibacillus farraposensis]MCC3382105.1 ImmA/IrrE family metallo-endopeptidase [Paenibacillus farraposensis]
MNELIHKLVRKYRTNCPFFIAKALGIHIRYCDLGSTTKGLYYHKLRRRFIVIHNGLTPEWERFVCAHELGHDRLHKGISRFFMEEHSYFAPGKFEQQANRFAVLLLSKGKPPQADETLEHYLPRIGLPKETALFFDHNQNTSSNPG